MTTTVATFVPTFGIFINETDPMPVKVGFATLREAIDAADQRRRTYVIRRSRYIPGYRQDMPGEGVFHRGMIVHTQR